MKTIRKTLVLLSFWPQVLGSSIFAQSNSWLPTGLYKKLPHVVVDKNNVIYAGGEGLYRSTDSGFNWADVSAKFPAQAISALGINSKNYLFACGTSSTADGKILIDLYCSIDSGNNWQKIYANLPDLIFAFASNNSGQIYTAAASAGVLKSTNDGNNWQTVNTGLANTSCLALAINSSGHIFAGTVNRGVYRSTDAGGNWQAINSGLLNHDVRALVIRADGKIFAGTNGDGIFRSTDNGNTWVQVNYGLNSGLIVDLALGPGGEIYASSNEQGGIFRSIDHGNTWTQINRGLPAGSPYYYIASDQKNHLFAGTYLSGLYHRVEVTSTAPLPPQPVSPANGTVDAPSSPLLIWRKTPGAKSYGVGVANVSYEPGSGVFGQIGIGDTSIKATGMIVNRTYSWRVFAENEEGKSGWSESWQFTTSYDNTRSNLVWPPNNATNVPTTAIFRWNAFPNATNYCLVISTFPYVIDPSAFIVKRCNSQDTSFQTTALSSNTTYYWWIQIGYPDGNSKYTAIYRFTTGANNLPKVWKLQESGTTESLRSVYFVDANNGWCVGVNGVILHTNNGGQIWNRQNSGTTVWLKSIHFWDSRRGIAVGGSGSILRTEDGGNIWIIQVLGAQTSPSMVRFVGADTVFIAGDPGIFRSTDGGKSWQKQFDIGGTAAHFINGKSGWVVGGSYILGSSYSRYFYTTDHGVTWARGNCDGGVLASVFFVNVQLGWVVGNFASDRLGGYPSGVNVLSSQDGGTTWAPRFRQYRIALNSINFANEKLGTAVGTSGLILQTTNGGLSWVAPPSGTKANLNSVYFADGKNGWAVGDSGVIIHTTTGGVTGVENKLQNTPPAEFSLKQNYPNPFNPNTTIEFSLSKASHVTLKIFNLRGEETATLTAREYLPGTYKLEWAAQGIASGVYFYRLQAGDWVATRKMALLR